MKLSVISLAAAMAMFSFGANAAPVSMPEPINHSRFTHKVHYRCGPGRVTDRRGRCVRVRRDAPPPSPRWHRDRPSRDWRGDRHHRSDRHYRDRGNGYFIPKKRESHN